MSQASEKATTFGGRLLRGNINIVSGGTGEDRSYFCSMILAHFSTGRPLTGTVLKSSVPSGENWEEVPFGDCLWLRSEDTYEVDDIHKPGYIATYGKADRFTSIDAQLLNGNELKDVIHRWLQSANNPIAIVIDRGDGVRNLEAQYMAQLAKGYNLYVLVTVSNNKGNRSREIIGLENTEWAKVAKSKLLFGHGLVGNQNKETLIVWKVKNYKICEPVPLVLRKKESHRCPEIEILETEYLIQDKPYTVQN